MTGRAFPALSHVKCAATTVARALGRDEGCCSRRPAGDVAARYFLMKVPLYWPDSL